ncbi:hypothetical protein LTR66_011747 [Elasticomyces elasticus]|nr:hypothetical protein LTR66_011747 [Elasticomyces elasticus]
MSLEVATSGRSASPTDSGRSTPVNRPPRREVEDGQPRKDKAFRRWAASIDRALSLFETAPQEWADYIAFLGRLLKTFQAHPQDVTTIPHAQHLSMRLAQCLNPTLPSGVHQKALELYAHVFHLIRSDGLSEELQTYLPGLLSVLSFASLSVRPGFYKLLEDHVLPLSSKTLRPAIRAIILSLLPALEEETSEDFERAFHLLENFQQASCRPVNKDIDDSHVAGGGYFWQCFFLATITSSSRRQGALAFLSRKLPRLDALSGRHPSSARRQGPELPSLSPEAEAVVSPEPGLLIRSLAAGLSDTQLLVQRGFLDLMVTHLPLHSVVLQDRVSGLDIDVLIKAAVSVVLRRDMSLNRRLWTWFLGPESSSGQEGGSQPASPTVERTNPEQPPTTQAQYFASYGKVVLSRCVLGMINQRSLMPAERARPLRICLSLMDRWEVGSSIIPEVFLPAMDSVFVYSQQAAKENVDDVIRSASLLFDGVESNLIWQNIIRLIQGAPPLNLDDRMNTNHALLLVRFILTTFNVREEDMLLTHMPLASLATVFTLDHQLQTVDAQTIELYLEILNLCSTAIPSRAFLYSDSSTLESNDRLFADHDGHPTNAVKDLDAAVSPHDGLPLRTTAKTGTYELLIQHGMSVFRQLLIHQRYGDAVERFVKTFLTILAKSPDPGLLHGVGFAAMIEHHLQASTSQPKTEPIAFPVLNALLILIDTLRTFQTDGTLLGTQQIIDFEPALTQNLWAHLSPTHPRHHVEAVRCIWQVETFLPAGESVEASLTRFLAVARLDRAEELRAAAEAVQRFTVLWTHTVQVLGSGAEKHVRRLSRRVSTVPAAGENHSSARFEKVLTRPLLLVLDFLQDDTADVALIVQSWLQSLPSVERVLAIVVKNLAHLLADLQGVSDGQTYAVVRNAQPRERAGPNRELLHYLKLLFNVLKMASEHTWTVCAHEVVDAPDQTQPSSQPISYQACFVQVCMRVLSTEVTLLSEVHQRAALSLLDLVLSNPYASALQILEVENNLINNLVTSLSSLPPSLQALYLRVIERALELRLSYFDDLLPSPDHRTPSLSLSSISASAENTVPATLRVAKSPPPHLVSCLRAGITCQNSQYTLHHWVDFLAKILPLFSDTIFASLLPLVESFCDQLNKKFIELKSPFTSSQGDAATAPESVIMSLFNGLELLLAKAHDRLLAGESQGASVRPPEQQQGFFGTMVAGVFAPETQPSRSIRANSRLTVLLSFQDTIRTCFPIWSWAGSGMEGSHKSSSCMASHAYFALRLRNRTRRMLEHVFAAEALQFVETLATLWLEGPAERAVANSASVFSLLHVLHGSTPKVTLPLLINALQSRVHLAGPDANSMTTPTSSLTVLDMVAFLIEYVRSVEDDAMDEIWSQCIAYLRDVLGNPLPHRQIMPALLEFAVLVAEKVENTNFGEQRKMRRELGDLFLRLLSAAFTTRSLETMDAPPVYGEKTGTHEPVAKVPSIKRQGLVDVLSSLMPRMHLVLESGERMTTAANGILTHVIAPAIHAKAFPDNVGSSMLKLLYSITKQAPNAKSWKKDVADAFNDYHLFTLKPEFARKEWFPVIRQWAVSDKERMPELLSRITAPTSAGIMFGVGANAARLEADRRTQFNLRRMAMTLLACDNDIFSSQMNLVGEKVSDLCAATASSSPSSATRAEMFMLLRALILTCSSVHMAPLWPKVNAELQAALSSVLPGHGNEETYNNLSLLQACKLLDVFIVMLPDEFQVHEWLYVTDTIDAVYRPENFDPVALADEITETLGSQSSDDSLPVLVSQNTNLATPEGRRPLLQKVGTDIADIKAMGRHDFVRAILRPFFSQLSIFTYEATYSMSLPDMEACRISLIEDLFDEASIAS